MLPTLDTDNAEGRMKQTIAIVASALVAVACTSMQSAGPTASAELAPTQGNTARGTVTFTQTGERVRVVANVTGLAPGPHGFHVHEKGDCSAPDATSAGGHFNPLAKPHGHYETGERHAGDMPAIPPDASGTATLSVTLGNATSVGVKVNGRSVATPRQAGQVMARFSVGPDGTVR